MGRHCGQLISLLCLMVWAGRGATQGDLEVVMARMHESALASASTQSPDTLLPLLQPDGSFSDLQYGKDGSTSFRTHGRRQGALAYHLLHGQDLQSEVVSCFTFITYDAPPNTDSNWWGHVIGTPTHMWEGVVLARDVLPPNTLADFLNRYWVDTMAGPVWNLQDQSDAMSGGNFAPRAMMAEVEGLLGSDPLMRHAEVDQEMRRELANRQPWDDNGLRWDGCLHQHNFVGDYVTENGYYLDHTLGMPYTGSYGKEMIKFLSKFVPWFTNTTLDFDEDTLEGLFSAYLDCNQWLFRGHTYEPSNVGRHITSGDWVTKYVTQGGVRDPAPELLKLGRHTQEVEAALHRYHNVLPDPQYALHGHRHFFCSDLSVHQRREFMASLRILSNRTVRPETWTSGENIDGYFQGDGFLTVLVDGGELGVPDAEVFQVYDWARVPGVTNLYTSQVPQYHIGSYWAEHFFNNATFVGGATDGTLGLAAMVYRRPHEPLTYTKSWFFFDDVIVVVASGVTLDPGAATGENVTTTLAQMVYAGEHSVGLEGGGASVGLGQGLHHHARPAWLHHRNLGYVFLAGDEQLTTSAVSQPLAADTLHVFTAWLDHDEQPANLSMAFALLPAADWNRTSSFAAAPEVEVLRLSEGLHAVCHRPSQVVGAALVAGGQLEAAGCGDVGWLRLAVDKPCLALLDLSDVTLVQLTLADPQQLYDRITVQLEVEGRVAEHTVELPSAPRKGTSVTTALPTTPA